MGVITIHKIIITSIDTPNTFWEDRYPSNMSCSLHLERKSLIIFHSFENFDVTKKAYIMYVLHHIQINEMRDIRNASYFHSHVFPYVQYALYLINLHLDRITYLFLGLITFNERNLFYLRRLLEALQSKEFLKTSENWGSSSFMCKIVGMFNFLLIGSCFGQFFCGVFRF